MLTNANFSGRNLTDFDFHDPATRERMEAWMIHTVGTIRDDKVPTKADLSKMSELLSIILKHEIYKVPYDRKKSIPKRHQRLICWYCIALETEKNMGAMIAKKEAADRFIIGEKSVQRYCTRHRKDIERMIEKFGYDEVSSGFRDHLTLYKKHREKHLLDS